MFIFNRPMAAVAGALGVAFLMIGLEQVCDRLPAAAAVTAPVAQPVPAVAGPVARLVPLQGIRFQRMSSPSRLQRNPETFPSGERWKILRSRGRPGTNSTSCDSTLRGVRPSDPPNR